MGLQKSVIVSWEAVHIADFLEVARRKQLSGVEIHSTWDNSR
jgi:hypothetical protein